MNNIQKICNKKKKKKREKGGGGGGEVKILVTHIKQDKTILQSNY